MIFSVWDPARRDYAYHEGPDTAGNPVAKHLSGGGGVGKAPYASAWPLPSDARLVGRGPTPRGVIAEPASLMGLSGIPNGAKSLIVVGLGWFFVWRWLRD